MKDVINGTFAHSMQRRAAFTTSAAVRRVSFNELIFILNRVFQTNLQPDYFDNPHKHYQNFTQADLTQNAKSALDYNPQFPLEAGVADYMKWL